MNGWSSTRVRAIAAALAIAAVVPAPARADEVRQGGVDVHWLSGSAKGEAVPDTTSGLVRSRALLAMDVSTSGLRAGHAITVWWWVFNEPRACRHPTAFSRCGAGDLLRSGTKASVHWAAAAIVQRNGSIFASGALRPGDTEGCDLHAGPCRGLLDPMEADVHVVIRDHGELDSGAALEQLRTYKGVCGEDGCANVQAAAHDAGPAGREVVISASYFRYCRSRICLLTDSAYPMVDGVPVTQVMSPQGVIDVQPGDTVTWVYRDPWCDTAGFAPYCPGHNVVFVDGSVRSPVLRARAMTTQTFSWRVPADAAEGTVIPYYCDVFFHYRVGMTGALRVV